MQAGTNEGNHIELSSYESVERTMAVNFNGSVRMAMAFLPLLVRCHAFSRAPTWPTPQPAFAVPPTHGRVLRFLVCHSKLPAARV